MMKTHWRRYCGIFSTIILVGCVIFACSDDPSEMLNNIKPGDIPTISKVECEPNCSSGDVSTGFGGSHDFIWVDPGYVMGADTSGTAWSNLKTLAAQSFNYNGTKNALEVTLYNQDGEAGAVALAKVLVFLRRGGAPIAYRDQVLAALDTLAARGSNDEDIDCNNGNLIAVSRQYPVWAIAADYLYVFMTSTQQNAFKALTDSLVKHYVFDDGDGDCTQNDQGMWKFVRGSANNKAAWGITFMAVAGEINETSNVSGITYRAWALRHYKGYMAASADTSICFDYAPLMTLTAWDSLTADQLSDGPLPIAKWTATPDKYAYGASCDSVHVRGMLSQELRRTNGGTAVPSDFASPCYVNQSGGNAYAKMVVGAIAIAAWVIDNDYSPGIMTWANGLKGAAFWIAVADGDEGGSGTLWEYQTGDKDAWVPYLVNNMLGLTGLKLGEPASGEGSSGMERMVGTEFLKDYF